MLNASEKLMYLVNFGIQLKQFAYYFVAEAHPKRFIESEIHLTNKKGLGVWRT